MYIVLTLQFKGLGSLNWSQVMENTCIILQKDSFELYIHQRILKTNVFYKDYKQPNYFQH